MEHNQSHSFEKAVIIIAHGSRLQQTADEMDELVEKLQKSMTDALVIPAFMELQQPDLNTSLKKAVDQGLKSISIVPLFFFTGRHMRDDIPAQIEDAKKLYPDCDISMTPCIGHTDEFVDALKRSVISL
ncbi:MAG: CbiX/SirB N-terminal domain-containing protein [Lentisphaeraceae bacterium]|nr:CbiX/SirB N-terminal domain-containing protein [Lentisphaeraceae bacterium]